MGKPSQKALVLMDNFTVQTTTPVMEKLENRVIVVMIPAGTTDRLQPLDVSINKSAKDFLRERFWQWYAGEVEKQLGDNMDESAVNVNMGMLIMKEAIVQSLTALYDRFRRDPGVIVSEFRKTGIAEEVVKAAEPEPVAEDPFASDDSD